MMAGFCPACSAQSKADAIEAWRLLLGENFFPTRLAVRRVLAIDGGGVRGVLHASFLATVESDIEGNVVDHFDLIVGTSTG
jgi:Patatin-like phospholipase